MSAAAPRLRRRTFQALAVAALPGVGRDAALAAPDPQALFTRDLTAGYEQQLVALDMEDVGAVFRNVRQPALGLGVAAGVDRAVRAARGAVAAAGGIRQHGLLVIATRLGEGRLREYRDAMNVVRDAALQDASLIYAACHDETLPAGTLRVTLLTG